MGILLTGNADLIRAALDVGITHFDTTAVRVFSEAYDQFIHLNL
jgi:diketogulonate reductase-like aldo/keto reductase